ncbi:MAG TPA: type II toxin-antitoxin system VapC family toxin [Solirubrobacteraceae bacterium]|nr:type II toxin-antitoxin system VapC family toxin [Solirubrobacteraceae bacterium]
MNGLLVDAHALLWALDEVARLPSVVQSELSAGVTPAFVSAATIWEIELKRSLGKLEAPGDLLDAVAAARFAELDITFAHARMAGGLPRHHGDPFDRMLVAQARSEGLTIVTADRRIAAYDVPVLW